MSARHLTLVLGRANTGKSAYLIEQLRALSQQDARAIVLVAEQYTFETELRLAHALGGLMGIQVLSFERLSERVLALAGQNVPFLSQQGYQMVLRRTAMLCQKELSAFSRIAAERGFAKEMADVLTALKRCCIAPEALVSVANTLPEGTPLREKLLDVSRLCQESEAYLDKRFLSREDMLSSVLSLLGGSFAAGASVFIDGLEGVTSQHFLLLEKLMEVSGSLTVTLRVDPLPGNDADVFEPDMNTMQRLLEIAGRLQIPVRTVEKTEAAKRLAPALSHLERNLYAYPAKIYEREAPEIELFGASSPMAEAESLADNILWLVRGGMRYRDIAVVASDMDAYLEPVSRAFSQRDIPVFFDGKRPVRSHAAAEMLLSSLRACANGFLQEDFLMLAKTGYAPVSDEDADCLQIFLEKTGLHGNALLRPFTKKDVPEGAERARKSLAEPLLRLREETAGGTASDKTRAVYRYLIDCAVDERLKERAAALAQAGRTALADEHAQVWNVLMALLSQMDTILGSMPISRKDYLAVLEEGLDGYAIGVVPGTSDQVLFGDVLRTRSRSVRALFLLGCNDGLLPRAANDDTLFNDMELAVLKDAGLNPWLDTVAASALDRLDLYSVLAKASERILFSYAFSADGSELAPSPLLARIERIVPNCVKKTDLEASDALPLSASEGIHMLSLDLARFSSDGDATKRLPALLSVFSERAADRALVSRMQSGSLLPALTALPAPLMRQLYGTRLTMSASRLERFNACPMQHFLQYGLRAKEKRVYEERPADLGTLYHDALDAFVKAVTERGLAFESIDASTVSALIEEILPECIASHNDGFFLSNERAGAQISLLIDTIQESATALVNHIKSGGFRPSVSEARFGEGCFFPAIPLTLPDGTSARLEGIIDRVDTAAGGKDGLVRVIDYKTHGRAFDYTGLFHGLTLQLPLYLYAASAGRKTPAGMYYMPLDVPSPEEGENYEDAVLRAFLLKGVTISAPEIIVSTDQKLDSPGAASDVVYKLRIKKDGTPTGELTGETGLGRIMDEAKMRAARTLSDMLAGKADVLPVEGVCQYCPYQAICRFDALLPYCRTRKLEKLDREAFFQKIGGDADA